MDRRFLALFEQYPDRYPQRLAREFPHVLDVISLLWGAPEMNRYFDTLLLTERKERQGFPASVMAEIFALREFHDMLYPQLAERADIWHAGVFDR